MSFRWEMPYSQARFRKKRRKAAVPAARLQPSHQDVTKSPQDDMIELADLYRRAAP
jgi:hypothetical protein